MALVVRVVQVQFIVDVFGFVPESDGLDQIQLLELGMQWLGSML
jgi:hypothetical protein